MGMQAVPSYAWCGQRTAPAWKGPPDGISVMSHAPGADRLLIRPAGEPGRCRQPGRQVNRKARQDGQMCDEPAQITDTDPGSSPSRAAPRTLTDVRHVRQLICDSPKRGSRHY